MTPLQESILKELDEYIDTHTPQEIYKTMFSEEYARLKKFNRQLWEKVINEQLEFSDEELFYSDNKILKQYNDADFLYLSNALLNLDNQNVDKSDFPIVFYGVKNNGKAIIIATMIGQGSVTNTCTLNGFKQWMERCKNTYSIDESKFYTLDELEAKVNNAIQQYENTITV